MSLKSRQYQFMKWSLIIFISITCTYYILPTLSSSCSSSPKTHVKAQVINVVMAVKQFKDDYGHLPQNWESLEGKNWRGKIYYSGIRETFEGNKVNIIYDTDGDNLIEIKGKKIEDCVAVWSIYKNEMITSWEK